eukprot:TRINITY_DN42997_c2_g1_i1.p1 TRINITY_DN42997_c2_g1~~TRINITY_DN42997_c2_g1_i1.p1  ORF type:complete len:75 (-),score=1.90 TRINITY_DN42997_c2_g1_i1:316-540(-)
MALRSLFTKNKNYNKIYNNFNINNNTIKYNYANFGPFYGKDEETNPGGYLFSRKPLPEGQKRKSEGTKFIIILI